MTPTLVDSNVLIDVASNDPAWAVWSTEKLATIGQEAALIINPLIYAELSIAYSTIEALDAALPEDIFVREALPWDAGFLAGKAFLAYRRRGGTRHSPLPDFYIGAHAAIKGYRLLTRDHGRYTTYFPRLEVIAP